MSVFLFHVVLLYSLLIAFHVVPLFLFIFASLFWLHACSLYSFFFLFLDLLIEIAPNVFVVDFYCHLYH